MLIDLVSPSSYLMINKNSLQALGLNNAVYCSELLTIYKKVMKKEKFLPDNYFKVDRKYIESQTSLEVKDQLACDINLSKDGVNIIKINEFDPNIIYFDVERFSQILAADDSKLIDHIYDKVKTSKPRGLADAQKKTKEQMIIENLQKGINCSNPDVYKALCNWIESIYGAGKGMSKIQVTRFKDRLNEYCGNDSQKAIKIIDQAIASSYVNCDWAISLYERQAKTNPGTNQGVRKTEQRTTLKLSEEIF